MKPNIAIITSGYLPLPPVKGGAVENLVQLLADENEQKNKLDLTIFSIYDKNAKDESVNYKNTHYVFIKIPVKLYCSLVFFYHPLICFTCSARSLSLWYCNLNCIVSTTSFLASSSN